MRPFVRGPEPDFLPRKSQEWGAAWEKNQSEKPSARFRWPQIAGVPLNQRLLPFLKAQTQDHCSFCDQFPVSPPSVDTIEHFRPKSRFPREAFAWGNLYYCCCYCQQKGEAYSDDLLRPDAEDYTFDRYFRWDYTQGRIEVNDRASPEDQDRAQETIKVYRLNERHPSLRRRSMLFWSRSTGESVDAFAYRHFIDPSA